MEFMYRVCNYTALVPLRSWDYSARIVIIIKLLLFKAIKSENHVQDILPLFVGCQSNGNRIRRLEHTLKLNDCIYYKAPLVNSHVTLCIILFFKFCWVNFYFRFFKLIKSKFLIDEFWFSFLSVTNLYILGCLTMFLWNY